MICWLKFFSIRSFLTWVSLLLFTDKHHRQVERIRFTPSRKPIKISTAPPTLPSHLPAGSAAAMKNLNCLLHQYVPKNRALSTATDEEIRMIQYRLNNRLRKRLGFKMPVEVIHKSLSRVALRT